ncbi:MAG: sigma-70 family RNA polymerase sigma factor [Bryobacterales bacterium]|nr:sigma-70 family RNA polymerase sigma factor [Bryobacterales bacterium]
MSEQVHDLIDHLFRRQSGRMVSLLTSIFGSRHLGLAEEVVQDALLRALELWPFQGIPDQPQAWLARVARNLALDRLRRESALTSKIPELERRLTNSPPPGEFADDHLAMMFLCCHPNLTAQARLCLTLKLVAGFSVPEIARALLTRDDAIAQRIVRAKRQIREENLPLELPSAAALPERIDSVLEALYLIFNEGYSASSGESLLRRDLCEEAIYLTSLLVQNANTATPRTHALLALQYLHAARLDARTDASGDLVLLEDQDRSLWDQRSIAMGFRHLDLSAQGEELTAYHIQAAIASQHAHGRPDWGAIVTLYDQLAALEPSPVVLLNRAVAVARRDGPRAGLAAVEEIARDPALARYYLLPAVKASLLCECGDNAGAAAYFMDALGCHCNAAERRFLERRLAGVQ